MENVGQVRSPASVIVLTIITCGIYGLIWIYRVSQELKLFLNDDSVNPGLEVFLNIICFPYGIYWFYKTGKLVYTAEKKANLEAKDDSLLYLLLVIFVGVGGIISMAILQSSLNKIWQA